MRVPCSSDAWAKRVVGLLAAVVAAALVCGCATAVPASHPHALLGKRVPRLSGRDLGGTQVAIPSSGSVTVVDVWATSCAPCLRAMPALELLHRRDQARGLAVVGVATDDNPGLVAEKLATLGVTYPNVVDADGSLQQALRAPTLPLTLVFDRVGTLRFVAVGGGEDDLRRVGQAARALLAE